ncbi:hypothetical protein IW262DRAFT_1469738 [Armillaria fumosa]|nr:hypothetical protein IW262DRAFT_1469738 [Armillaria fumosa]
MVSAAPGCKQSSDYSTDSKAQDDDQISRSNCSHGERYHTGAGGVERLRRRCSAEAAKHHATFPTKILFIDSMNDSFASNLKGSHSELTDTVYSAYHASGRPAKHYLKLMWYQDQQDLVPFRFAAIMAFTDAALERDIALVMRAGAKRSLNVPPET